MEYYPMIT